MIKETERNTHVRNPALPAREKNHPDRFRWSGGSIPGLPALAAVLLAACSSGGPGEPSAAPAPADNPFMYDVPSPPAATYEIADTNTMIMTTPQGEMDMAQKSSATLALTFVADSGGVRVSGTVSNYSAGMSSSMMGDMDLGGNGVSGDLEFVIGPWGDVEMISTPEVAGGALPVPTPFQFSPPDMFPRFPGHPLEPGDTWADTMTSSEDLDEVEGISGAGTNTTIYTYTLVGDTVVAGLTLHKITVSGAGTMQVSGTEPEAGGEVSQDMTNTVEGFYLWDADRGLVVLADLVRTVDGTMSMGGMGGMAMTMAGPSRMRLVN